jgi:uncharacterized protein (DUF1697 family)
MVIVSLLRGVNVGAHNRMKMEALRAVYASLGLRDVQTYVQSGNVVYRSNAKKLPASSRRIEDALEAAFGFRPAVIERTLPGLREVVANNPFAGRDGLDPAKLLVTFLADDPGETARREFVQIPAHSEELRAVGCETWIYYPNGLGTSTLSPTLVGKALKTAGTSRNWNTVLKLLEMAEHLESAAS